MRSRALASLATSTEPVNGLLRPVFNDNLCWYL